MNCQLYIFFHKNIICSQKKLDLSFHLFFLIKLLKLYLICIIIQRYSLIIQRKCTKCTRGESLSKSGHKTNMRGDMIHPKKKLLFILWEVLTNSSIKMSEDKTYTVLFMRDMNPWKVGWAEVQMLCINHFFNMVNEVQRLKL